jgi:hypothetical protein
MTNQTNKAATWLLLANPPLLVAHIIRAFPLLALDVIKALGHGETVDVDQLALLPILGREHFSSVIYGHLVFPKAIDGALSLPGLDLNVRQTYFGVAASRNEVDFSGHFLTALGSSSDWKAPAARRSDTTKRRQGGARARLYTTNGHKVSRLLIDSCRRRPDVY